MSSKSARRRKRKSKQKIAVDYTSKFSIIDETKAMTALETLELLTAAYIHTITKRNNNVPFAIVQLCHSYLNNGQIIFKDLSAIIPSVTHKINNRNYAFIFNETFNALSVFEKRLVCKKIAHKQSWQIEEITVWKNENKSSLVQVCDELYFVEYMLYKRYNTITILDLSEMQWTDNHILYFCNIIPNIIDSLKKTSHSAIKHSKQRPNTSENDTKVKDLQKRKKKKVGIWMKLKEINLSKNNITDKNLQLLLKTIKLYMPQLKLLNLSENLITNESFTIVKKWRLHQLTIEMTSCKNISMEELDKYQKTSRKNGVSSSPYCYWKGALICNAVWEKEDEYDPEVKRGKKISGKGKKFQAWNRKSGFCNELWWDCR